MGIKDYGYQITQVTSQNHYVSNLPDWAQAGIVVGLFFLVIGLPMLVHIFIEKGQKTFPGKC